MNFLTAYVAELLARLDGPLHFRFYAQPLMAILLAIRDGSRDAREGRSAYLWSLFTDPAGRRDLVADGWKGISRVFFLACVLDVVYQLITLHGLRPLQVLLIATILAVVPYLLLRGPVNRLRHRFSGASRG